MSLRSRLPVLLSLPLSSNLWSQDQHKPKSHSAGSSGSEAVLTPGPTEKGQGKGTLDRKRSQRIKPSQNQQGHSTLLYLSRETIEINVLSDCLLSQQSRGEPLHALPCLEVPWIWLLRTVWTSFSVPKNYIGFLNFRQIQPVSRLSSITCAQWQLLQCLCLGWDCGAPAGSGSSGSAHQLLLHLPWRKLQLPWIYLTEVWGFPGLQCAHWVTHTCRFLEIGLSFQKSDLVLLPIWIQILQWC